MLKVDPAIRQSEPYRHAAHIVRRLRGAGHEAYFVGGAPRDLWLQRAPADYDIATDARPEEIRGLFDKTIPVGEQFGVLLVVLGGEPFEVATFRADEEYLDGRRPVGVQFSSAAEDARRRDFTINALMFDPVEEELIDFVGGREDIERRVVRTVGDPEERFSEDHLRLIRAVRFAARLGFAIEEATAAAIRKLAHLLSRVSAERLAAELIKIVTGPGAGRALQLLSDTDLLKHFLPEVEQMKGCEQPPNFHPEGDVFVHTCLMLDMAECPTATLALGSLLHDVGKPPTQEYSVDRIRFNRHTQVGAEMAQDICRRLRLSNAVTERVVYLVANHLKPKDAPGMRPARLKRFFREEGFPELLELFRLDTLASHGDLQTYDWCREVFEEISQEEMKPPPLLTGHDLIDMGFRPGPLFSEILDAVEEAQLDGDIASPDEARKWVMEHYAPEG